VNASENDFHEHTVDTQPNGFVGALVSFFFRTHSGDAVQEVYKSVSTLGLAKQVTSRQKRPDGSNIPDAVQEWEGLNERLPLSEVAGVLECLQLLRVVGCLPAQAELAIPGDACGQASDNP